MPALVQILLFREQEKGAPLTEQEVLAIRDAAPCIALPRDEAAAIAKHRGYDDIDLENLWEDWQAVRRRLTP